VAVTERFKKYLTRDRTGVFNIYSEFAGCIDLDQSEINDWLDKFQRGSLEACSALEANRSTILDLNVEECVDITAFLAGQGDFNFNFFIVSNL
jgi:hypothetical protein